MLSMIAWTNKILWFHLEHIICCCLLLLNKIIGLQLDFYWDQVFPSVCRGLFYSSAT